jgi:pyridoxamine 5'-phosphate oxidase
VSHRRRSRPHRKWGGYRLVVARVEFWTHRDDRLHDRVRYRRESDGWHRERLAP